MRINEQVVDTLERAYKTNAWHGPALLETLEGVNHEIAAARPIPGSHSIWELVIHLTAWKDVVRKRLSSTVPILPTDSEDWPPLPALTSANWTTTLERLDRAQQQIVDAIRALAPSSFDDIVPGKDYSVFVMLLGVAQHDDYHGGQISLLKKTARVSK
jgi:uncharacterized damage-inducible protein DinB